MDNYNSTQLPVEGAGEGGYDKDSYQIKGEETAVGHPSNYTGVEDPAQFVSHTIPGYELIGAEASFQSPSCGFNQGVQAPALDYNGYVLYASSQPVPEELMREPTGSSIAEPGAVLDEENGRTYVAHETGKYYLPNDPVRTSHRSPTLLFVPPLIRMLRPGRTGSIRPPAQGLHNLSGWCTLSCSYWAPRVCARYCHWDGDMGDQICPRTPSGDGHWN